eukprot:3995439-Amphidinium_carterae.1
MPIAVSSLRAFWDHLAASLASELLDTQLQHSSLSQSKTSAGRQPAQRCPVLLGPYSQLLKIAAVRVQPYLNASTGRVDLARCLSNPVHNKGK